MRSAEQRPDGSLVISNIDKTLKDLERYMKNREGMSIVDIARAERMDPKSAEQSIRRGGKMFEAEQQMRLRDAKYEGAIENEKIRTKTREQVADIFVTAIKTLLQGKRTVVETNKETGEVTLHEITDPEIIAMGLAAARKTLSLEEKVGPSMVFNFQQNNLGGDAGDAAGGGLSYEERLEQIRASQEGRGAPVPASRAIIDATVVDVTPVKSEDTEDEDPPLF